jgi:HEAT repeat protein
MNLVYLIVEAAPVDTPMRELVEKLRDVSEAHLVLGIREGSPKSRVAAIKRVHKDRLVSEDLKCALLGALERPLFANTRTPDVKHVVREVAAYALERYPEDRAVQRMLLSYVAGNDLPNVVQAAQTSLLKMKCPYVIEQAMDMLRSGDPSKNLFGAHLLGGFAHEPAEQFILNLIQKRPRLAKSFLRSLGKFGTKRSVDALLVYAKHRDWEYREAAVSALASTIDRKDVRAVLDAALKDSLYQVRVAAMQAYAQTGRVPQMELVLSWLDADSYAERQAAAEAMVHFVARQEARVRLEVLAHDARETVAGAAAYALRYYPGIRAARAISHVVETVSDSQIRDDALESLRLHPSTPEYLEELLQEAADKDYFGQNS